MFDVKSIVTAVSLSAVVAYATTAFTRRSETVEGEKLAKRLAQTNSQSESPIQQEHSLTPQHFARLAVSQLEKNTEGESQAAGSQEAKSPVVNPEPTADPVRELAMQLQERFDQERAAAQDDRVREAALRTAFTSGELQGTKLNRLECRPGICRLELTFRNVDADHADVRRLFIEPTVSATLGMASAIPSRTVNSDGTIDATAYFYNASGAGEADDDADG